MVDSAPAPRGSSGTIGDAPGFDSVMTRGLPGRNTPSATIAQAEAHPPSSKIGFKNPGARVHIVMRLGIHKAWPSAGSGLEALASLRLADLAPAINWPSIDDDIVCIDSEQATHQAPWNQIGRILSGGLPPIVQSTPLRSRRLRPATEDHHMLFWILTAIVLATVAVGVLVSMRDKRQDQQDRKLP
jgi:hypothetical protein